MDGDELWSLNHLIAYKDIRVRISTFIEQYSYFVQTPNGILERVVRRDQISSIAIAIELNKAS